MPAEPEQTQIPTARASAFNGSLPPPDKSDTMDELMCTAVFPLGLGVSPMQILPGPRVRPHDSPPSFISHRFDARGVIGKNRGKVPGVPLAHHLAECNLHPHLAPRCIAMNHQVVARSPDLATWPTEDLQPQARRETYGPADGGVWRPAPNRQFEIRKLFPARSLILILLLLVLLLLLDAWP